MDRNALRSKIQSEALEAWVEHGYNGYGLISVGVGKSRLMALAIHRYLQDHPEFDYKKYDFPIVILINSSELRDTGIPEELKKWGVKTNVKTVCYQTAYRWKKKIGLLIADELDFAITEGKRYLQVFQNCKYDNWLGLTGTMIESKGEIAEEQFGSGPFYEFPLYRAQDFGLINKTEIWVHEVPLYTSSTPSAPYGEVSKYKYIQNIIQDCKNKISSIYDELAYNPTFDREYELKEIIQSLKKKKEWWESKPSNPNCRLTMMRTMMSLSEYAKKLKKVILSDESNKVILFGELTSEIDKIALYAYHGKKADREVIDRLNSGEVRELGVVRKVQRGVNFHKLNHAIVHSFTSSVTNANQAYIGRMVRLEPDEIARVHFLVSYYYEGDEKIYCQNHNWLNTIMSSEELKHLTINYYDGINLLQ